MDRNISTLSQDSLLSEGAMREVVDLVGDVNLDMLMKDEVLNTFLSQDNSYVPDIITQPVEDISPLQNVVDTSLLQGVPTSTGKVPCLNVYPGPYNFQIQVQDESSDRKKWLFSTPLNKLFVNMSTKIPVKFKWHYQEPGLQIRMLLVYTSEEHFEYPVTRCPRHSILAESSNKGSPNLNHVIQSDHEGTQYHEDPESHRLSIVVPVSVAPMGTDWVTIEFTFGCKNSCSIGMNRRSTAIIFTLERSNGEVIGRQIMQVRICSCPKRDMTKEEKDFHEKVVLDSQVNGQHELHQTPTGETNDQPKRRRIVENPDGETFTMIWSAKRAARLAKMATSLILEKAYKERRELTQDEKSYLEKYKEIIFSCERKEM